MNKINKSIELYKEAKLHMPGGVNSPVRAFKNINGNPIFFKKAKGPYLIDADNNKYIDYIGSWGPMILGHSNPKIIKAVSRQLELGTSYGAPTSIESDTAKLIKKCFPSIQKIRMVNSGTEATMSAVRLARGYTNKTKIIKFDGCYHGHVDSLLIKAGSGVSTFGLPDSPGIPNELAKKTLSCEFNNKDSFLKIFNKVKNDLAAVIVEPIAGNMGFVPGDKSFLKLLRKKTSENNSLLIFDEVMTGFRVSLGGAQELYKFKPDLTFLCTVNNKNMNNRLKIRSNNNRYDNFKINFYNKVQKGFLKLAKSNKKSYKIIDSNLDIKINEDLIINQIKKLIK